MMRNVPGMARIYRWYIAVDLDYFFTAFDTVSGFSKRKVVETVVSFIAELILGNINVYEEKHSREIPFNSPASTPFRTKTTSLRHKLPLHVTPRKRTSNKRPNISPHVHLRCNIFRKPIPRRYNNTGQWFPYPILHPSHDILQRNPWHHPRLHPGHRRMANHRPRSLSRFPSPPIPC